jgi:anti-anti-sigma factor
MGACGEKVPGVSLSWSYEHVGDVLAVHLSGLLAAACVELLDAAVTWVLAQQPRAVLIDASGITSWSAEGQTALADAASLIHDRGTRVCLSGPSKLVRSAAPVRAVGVHADVADALAALTRGSRPAPG